MKVIFLVLLITFLNFSISEASEVSENPKCKQIDGVVYEKKEGDKALEVWRLIQEKRLGETINQSEYCDACKYSYQKFHNDKSGEVVFKWMVMQCSESCELNKLCNYSESQDPRIRWNQLKKEQQEMLQDPEKLKAHCDECNSNCTEEKINNPDAPLLKWRCIQCKKECAENSGTEK